MKLSLMLKKPNHCRLMPQSGALSLTNLMFISAKMHTSSPWLPFWRKLQQRMPLTSKSSRNVWSTTVWWLLSKWVWCYVCFSPSSTTILTTVFTPVLGTRYWQPSSLLLVPCIWYCTQRLADQCSWWSIRWTTPSSSLIRMLPLLYPSLHITSTYWLRPLTCSSCFSGLQ